MGRVIKRKPQMPIIARGGGGQKRCLMKRPPITLVHARLRLAPSHVHTQIRCSTPVTVDIAQSPTVKDGLKLSTIATGAIVKVKGTFSNGVLVAKEVEPDSHERTQTGGCVKLFGAVSAIDANAKTFVLQGVTVTIGNNTSGVPHTPSLRAVQLASPI